MFLTTMQATHQAHEDECSIEVMGRAYVVDLASMQQVDWLIELLSMHDLFTVLLYSSSLSIIPNTVFCLNAWTYIHVYVYT